MAMMRARLGEDRHNALKSAAPKPAATVCDKPKRPETARAVAKMAAHAVRTNGASPTLTGPEQRIVDAIAWLESIGVEEPEQSAAAFLAGYTIGGGAWNNPRGALRTKGLIEYRGDRLALTDEGRALANLPEVALTTDELHRRVTERLSGPCRKILIPCLDAYPSAIPNDELARLAGYEPNGGAYNNPRGRLRSLGLIEYPEPGMVRARDILFL
jgi:hypothetical protein